MATGFSVFVNIGGKVNPSLAAAVGQAKAQVKTLASSLSAIGKGIHAPFLAANKHIDATSKRMASMQKAGRNAALTISAPAAWFGASLIDDIAKFDKAGNFVEALGEATKDQRNTLDALSVELAKKYDAGGATEILKAATELLKAGFSFDQARGSLEQVLAASALAGDMTPADVGSSLSKTITQFQMPMKTYEDSMKSASQVTDRMVYAAVSTVASMKDVAETFKYVGGLASSTGTSLDQTTAIVMAFAKAGTLGSEAGIALRSAIVRLVKMPKGGMAALERVGMKLGDYTSTKKVTADGVLGNLKADGIDASKAKKQIAKILANRGTKDSSTVNAEITAAVQKAIGGAKSAVDASKIAENVSEAINVAGSKIDITKFFKDLKAKVDAGLVGPGELAQILEGRHISKYQAIMRADLDALLKDVESKADGYSQDRYKVANQGLPAALLKLQGTWFKLKKTVADSVGSDLVNGIEGIASKMEEITKASPKTFKIGAGLAAAAVAAGPLLYVLGAVGRVGALAMKGLNLVLMGLLLPFRLVGAAAVGLGARVAVMAVGMQALMRVGSGAVLAGLAGSLLRFGKAILLFPLVALRGIGVALASLFLNPVGLVIAALVIALTALGVWVYNNWEGIKKFFAGFGTGFTDGLDKSNGTISTMVGWLGKAYDWLSKMLGPLDLTADGWRRWGEAIGGSAAAGVNAVVTAIGTLIAGIQSAIKFANDLGTSIGNLWKFGSGGAPTGQGGGSSRAGKVPARALGGSVTAGRAHLVGERGIELFTPGTSGRIHSNGDLRRMTENGTAATASTSSSSSSSSINTAHIAIHVGKGADAGDVAREAEAAVYRAFARLESDQRGLLSD